ncbi:hypothetical protein MUG87_19305 [Ectobacillus sp. JY-23]|uniref:hypothetical protein n=1 Tax=Ectobacillus sp. JY-23 TaxID=2933872 RepID=UPI001FF65988|nr:hypothetical protein [Ectobacillus sp. JY-23]UOY92530.1 hypothetical protein MUG87_19305 [Ectobacillus sp. JY-23]
MFKAKIHPLILLNCFVNAIIMGMFAFDMYEEGKMMYTAVFAMLFVLFACISGYGLYRNQRFNS